MENRHLCNFQIAGFTYYEGAEVFNELKIGTHLTLKREPENKFDPYAIALYYNDKKLGFVPRGENKELSKFLEMGYSDIFTATINQIDPHEYPENQVGVIVKIKKAGE